SKPEDAETEKDCKRRVKDLGEQWRDEARRRLRAAVMKAAPHQASLHLKFDDDDGKKAKKHN
ncbi:MAG: hypothetical protein KC503_34250, partial [Myxococcales bacterium]|nr:hypothetical protein [Myxococcales bacterium]